MPIPDQDTISAIITPPGTGGISVIRVSGPAAIPLVNEIFRGGVILSEAHSHTVHFGTIVDVNGIDLDEVLATVFRAPHSYTAEDVVEISCHGSSYLARRVLDLVVSRGARPAGPGEFTKRAFLNGRIDLAQAEAVADLINADSRSSHDLALAQLRGTLSGKVSVLRQKIVDLCSTLELELDFSEEGLEFIKRDELRENLVSVVKDISQLIDSYDLGKIYRDGLRVVIVGAPNVGKSSILNCLVREDRAIVTAISGTTRDTIEESVSIDGMKFMIVDTAGIRQSSDPVETEGIRRTREQVQHADLILFVMDPTQDIRIQTDEVIGGHGTLSELDNRLILVVNKVDLINDDRIDEVKSQLPNVKPVWISAINGIGIPELERVISEKTIEPSGKTRGETIILSNIRQKDNLTNSVRSLEIVLGGIDSGATPDLLAVDLRVALLHLSHVVGVDISMEVLENIFSRFCIGK